jgi:hypothetical protein
LPYWTHPRPPIILPAKLGGRSKPSGALPSSQPA